ncbi:MAG: hypothetical protein PHN56_05435 [Candidatus Nanoarchaeia archaeon]|nr:hypothetical protein [Candidatus Nanoarchaeia archaeon]
MSIFDFLKKKEKINKFEFLTNHPKSKDDFKGFSSFSFTADLAKHYEDEKNKKKEKEENKKKEQENYIIQIENEISELKNKIYNIQDKKKPLVDDFLERNPGEGIIIKKFLSKEEKRIAFSNLNKTQNIILDLESE